VLDKRAIEFYKSMKEGLGTHSPSHETVCRLVNDIKNGWAETECALHCAAPTSVMHERHMEQVNSVLEYTCNISCKAIATEVRISPASVYCILTNSLGKQKVCAKWIPHMLNDDQRAVRLLLATTHLQHWKYEGNAFLHHILMVDES